MAEYKPEFNYYSVNLDIQTPTSTQEKPSYNIPNVVIPSKNIPELPASEQITTGADWSEVEDDDGNKPADNATDDTAADAAQGTANLRITTFIQSAIPTSLAAGDLFIDTDDGKMYRATGIGDTTIEAGKWIRVDLGLYPELIDVLSTTNAPAVAGATDDTAANLRVTTFYQSAIPTSLAAGDMWLDSDDGKLYRATGVGDTTIEAGKWIRIDTGLYPGLIDALQTTNAPAAAGADVTSANQAATIASQGALATQNTADFATDVDGAEKPANNATVGAIAGTNFTGAGTDNNQVSDAGEVARFLRQIFGNGSDGDVTISTPTTLTSDMFYNNLTVNDDLEAGGYRIFIKGTLTVATGKTINRVGNAGGNGGNASGITAGTASTAGAALANGSIQGALAGNIGVAGNDGKSRMGSANGSPGVTNTNNGADINKSLTEYDGNAGGAGGKGGNALNNQGGAGGTGSTAGSRTGTVYNKIDNAIAAYRLTDDIPSLEQLKTAPQNGNGGSGGTGEIYASGIDDNVSTGGTGGSGGGGGNGGIVVVFARDVVLTGNISSNGGAGGNSGTTAPSDASLPTTGGAGVGGSGGSAGGNGGNGGITILVYNTKSGAGSVLADGGVGGTGGTAAVAATRGGESADNGVNGDAGTVGRAGRVIELEV